MSGILPGICDSLLSHLEICLAVVGDCAFSAHCSFGLVLALLGLVLLQRELTAAPFKHDGLDGLVLDWNFVVRCRIRRRPSCVYLELCERSPCRDTE